MLAVAASKLFAFGFMAVAPPSCVRRIHPRHCQSHPALDRLARSYIQRSDKGQRLSSTACNPRRRNLRMSNSYREPPYESGPAVLRASEGLIDALLRRPRTWLAFLLKTEVRREWILRTLRAYEMVNIRAIIARRGLQADNREHHEANLNRLPDFPLLL